MIVVDGSVWLVLVFEEPGAARYLEAIEAADGLLVSAATVVEVNMIVTQKKGPQAAVDVVDLMELAGTEIVAVDSDQAGHAVSGFIRFGSGLNYGDLFAYALARHRDLPLLYVGDTFDHTDVRPALPVERQIPA